MFTVKRYFVAGAAGVELFLTGLARAVAANARADKKEEASIVQVSVVSNLARIITFNRENTDKTGHKRRSRMLST